MKRRSHIPRHFGVVFASCICASTQVDAADIAGTELNQVQKKVFRPSGSGQFTATVGSQLVEKLMVYESDGAVIQNDVLIEESKPSIAFAANEPLALVYTSAKAKACGTSQYMAPCLLDDDGDGLFDRYSRDFVAKAKPLKVKIPYVLQRVRYDMDQSGFRQSYNYLGRNGQQLRIGYREFVNDLARPAFSEELSVELPTQIPGRVTFKDIKLDIMSVGPEGLTYRIVASESDF